MKHISDLFLRYKTVIQPPQSSVINDFIIVCEEVTGYTITAEQCSYTVATKTIYLQTPSVLKSELLRQKPALLTQLTKKLGKHAPIEIV